MDQREFLQSILDRKKRAEEASKGIKSEESDDEDDDKEVSFADEEEEHFAASAPWERTVYGAPMELRPYMRLSGMGNPVEGMDTLRIPPCWMWVYPILYGASMATDPGSMTTYPIMATAFACAGLMRSGTGVMQGLLSPPLSPVGPANVEPMPTVDKTKQYLAAHLVPAAACGVMFGPSATAAGALFTAAATQAPKMDDPQYSMFTSALIGGGGSLVGWLAVAPEMEAAAVLTMMAGSSVWTYAVQMCMDAHRQGQSFKPIDKQLNRQIMGATTAGLGLLYVAGLLVEVAYLHVGVFIMGMLGMGIRLLTPTFRNKDFLVTFQVAHLVWFMFAFSMYFAQMLSWSHRRDWHPVEALCYTRDAEARATATQRALGGRLDDDFTSAVNEREL